jgi:hypothetical protein
MRSMTASLTIRILSELAVSRCKTQFLSMEHLWGMECRSDLPLPFVREFWFSCRLGAASRQFGKHPIRTMGQEHNLHNQREGKPKRNFLSPVGRPRKPCHRLREG